MSAVNLIEVCRAPFVTGITAIALLADGICISPEEVLVELGGSC